MNDKVKKRQTKDISSVKNEISDELREEFNNNKSIISIIGKNGSGKTSLIVKTIESLSKDKKNILFISLDENKNIIKKRYSEYFNDEIEKENIYIVDQPCSVKDIENKVKNNNIDYVFIDYIELLENSNDEKEIYDMINNLKTNGIKFLIVSSLIKEDTINGNIKNNSDIIYLINDKN